MGLTSTSATSHILLKILLERHHGVRPDYFVFGEDPREAFALGGDAALLIGDSALEHFRNPPDGCRVYDLGAEWERYAGTGMVFAVWAVRREFAAFHGDIVSHTWGLGFARVPK